MVEKEEGKERKEVGQALYVGANAGYEQGGADKVKVSWTIRSETSSSCAHPHFSVGDQGYGENERWRLLMIWGIQIRPEDLHRAVFVHNPFCHLVRHCTTT